MKTRNNNIYMVRGDTCTMKYRCWCTDGKPFVLPPTPERSLYPLVQIEQQGDITQYLFYTPFLIAGAEVTLHTDTECNVAVDIFDTGAERVTSNTTDRSYTISGTGSITAITVTGGKLVSLEVSDQEWSQLYEAKPVLTSVLVLSVRAADTDATVIEKCLNLHGGITQVGRTDYTWYGWNKFTSQDPVVCDTVGEALSTLIDKFGLGEICIAEVDGSYYHLRMPVTGEPALEPYEFCVNIPFSHEDTTDLTGEDYVYSITVYQGYLDYEDFIKDSFPFSKQNIVWKKTLLDGCKLILRGV